MDGCTSRHHSHKGGDAHAHTRGHSLTDLHPASQGLEVHIPMVVASAGMKEIVCSRSAARAGDHGSRAH